jgi:hypothetical protein
MKGLSIVCPPVIELSPAILTNRKIRRKYRKLLIFLTAQNDKILLLVHRRECGQLLQLLFLQFDNLTGMSSVKQFAQKAVICLRFRFEEYLSITSYIADCSL